MSPAKEDRISILYDDLLHRILSYNPSTKFYIQTSVFSEHWRHLWTHHPSLHLSGVCVKSDDINLCLQAFNVSEPSIPQSSTPSLSTYKTPTLQTTGSRSVCRLAVDTPGCPRFGDVMLPCSLVLCRSSLTYLAITGTKYFPDIPRDFQGFSKLKSLSLSGGFITNETLAGLLAACPVLEILQLLECKELSHVEISARNLPWLTHLLMCHIYFLRT